MQQFLQNLQSLGRRKLLMLGAVGVVSVLALVFGLSVVTAPSYKLLYSQLSPSSAAGIVDTLEQAGFKTQLSADGSAVSVPEGDIARARMALAEKNLPVDGEPGWELFDNASGFGMNTFMQHVNRLRAMEGELARSIQTIDGVRSARVHLVLPEREAFSRTSPDPSASVIVRAASSRGISRKEALAIRNLIAAAVPNLDGNRVTVLSASGETILAENSDAAGQATLQSNKAATEDRMARSIEQILTARVGAGNARVQVNVDLSNQREVVVQQSFDPDQQVVRSTQNNAEQQKGVQNGDSGVNTGNNIPGALGGPGASSTTDSRSKNGESVQYEIGNTRRETTTEAGAVQRVSVAVLVNGIYNVQDDGSLKYEQRSPEEIARLTALVKSAIGYDQNRGDTVSVDSLRFIDYSMEVGGPVGPTLMQRLSNNIVSILRWVFALLIVVAVLVFGLRPLLNRADRERARLSEATGAGALAAPEGEAEAATPASNNLPATPANAVAPRTQEAAEPAAPVQRAERYDPAGDEELITNFAISGAILKRKVSAIQKIAEDEPQEALKVLRGWLLNEA
ncbi:MAG: flagellar M-ring protein FliF [Thioclava sp.]|nr:flagellar M-ring protein FliF [Thioclava sp.]